MVSCDRGLKLYVIVCVSCMNLDIYIKMPRTCRIVQKVWETRELQRSVVIKHRFSKSYRLPELDKELTLGRLRQEVRSILRARKLGIRVPTLVRVNLEDSCIVMDKIEGLTLKDALLNDRLIDRDSKVSVLEEMGRMIGKLHDGNLIHGDLTTSNVMIRTPQEGSAFLVYIIDFGLSQFSQLSEDKAVDLYVLERSFNSAHPVDGEEMFASFLTSYRKSSRKWCSTLNRLAEVRQRGRKRSMVG